MNIRASLLRGQSVVRVALVCTDPAASPGSRGDRWGTIDLVHADRRIGRLSTAGQRRVGPAKRAISGQLSAAYPVRSVSLRALRPPPPEVRPTAGP